MNLGRNKDALKDCEQASGDLLFRFLVVNYDLSELPKSNMGRGFQILRLYPVGSVVEYLYM